MNNRKDVGRWAFAEFDDVGETQIEFAKKVESDLEKLIDRATAIEVLQ